MTMTVNEAMQDAVNEQDRVGVVGSGTSNNELVVDLVGAARDRSLNGRMVLVQPGSGPEGQEYALGTVTEIVNRNRFHEDIALRGVIVQRGGLAGLTGSADIKTATVRVQSAFRATQDRIVPAGGAMTFAANTGEPVYTISEAAVDALARQSTNDLFYLGTIYREPGIKLPMSVPDFSGPRGASMAGFFGPSGSSKTATGTLYIGSQMRHRKMSFLLVDPQGQFTTGSKVGSELPLDLRSLAEAQGREVVQLSVARGVRLPEDPDMFCQMLASTSMFTAKRLFGASGKSQDLSDIIAGWLEGNKGWSERDADELLGQIIEHLMNVTAQGMVYAGVKRPSEDEDQEMLPQTTDAGNRLWHNLRSMITPDDYPPETHDGRGRRAAILRVFAPFLSMFSPTSMDGEPRTRISEIVKKVCEPIKDSAGARKPRPFVILTLADQIADERGQAGLAAKALSGKETQAVILRTLFSALERHARWLYQETDMPSPNLMVIMDEAARFASARDRRHGSQSDFAEDLAQYFRELRKYSIGFTLLLQEPAALHDSIWKQLRNGFRAFAGGLVGTDLDRIKEQVGDQGAMSLYAALPVPSGSNPRYPFMLCGAVSPLSATGSPLFLEVFSGDGGVRPIAEAASKWAAANSEWLPPTYSVTDVWKKPASSR